jgi:hypothetical protein
MAMDGSARKSIKCPIFSILNVMQLLDFKSMDILMSLSWFVVRTIRIPNIHEEQTEQWGKNCVCSMRKELSRPPPPPTKRRKWQKKNGWASDIGNNHQELDDSGTEIGENTISLAAKNSLPSNCCN